MYSVRSEERDKTQASGSTILRGLQDIGKGNSCSLYSPKRGNGLRVSLLSWCSKFEVSKRLTGGRSGLGSWNRLCGASGEILVGAVRAQARRDCTGMTGCPEVAGSHVDSGNT